MQLGGRSVQACMSDLLSCSFHSTLNPTNGKFSPRLSLWGEATDHWVCECVCSFLSVRERAFAWYILSVVCAQRLPSVSVCRHIGWRLTRSVCVTVGGVYHGSPSVTVRVCMYHQVLIVIVWAVCVFCKFQAVDLRFYCEHDIWADSLFNSLPIAWFIRICIYNR